MTCIRLLASKRRSRLKEILYTKELVPRMRSRPKQSARISINTGGQSSLWQAFPKLQKRHLCTLQLASCVQVWRRVVVAAAAASRFRFWLGLSLGYGLDSLISSCLVRLEKGVPPFFWLSSLGFSSRMILFQG